MADSLTSLMNKMGATIGGMPEAIPLGIWVRFSTNGKRGNKDGYCLRFPDGGAAVFGCWRQGITETWTAKDRATMTRIERAELARQVEQATVERHRLQRERWAQNKARMVELQGQLRPLQLGDAGTMYLKRRGLGGLWPLPDCLRLHPSLPYWYAGRELGRFPALVAPITAPDGRVVSLHRTYLRTDGNKAHVPIVKKLTAAAGSLAGAAIPLGSMQNGLIGIAEGIETALAAWAGSGVPTVAGYCANALAGWQWPAGARRIVVFADHDRAGLDAAEALQARALKGGLRCEVHTPSEPGQDWADVWLSGQAPVIGTEVLA